MSSRRLPSGGAPGSLTLIMPLHPELELTPSLIEQLQQRATAVAYNSYAPYSNYRVGAAVLLTDGSIVTGCNVENTSYRLTCCAEQSAIAAAVGLYGPYIRIRAIAVANLNDSASQPCGACRQTILEFGAPDAVVFFPREDGSFDQAAITELLPAAFFLTK
jgi:cytidine deaminase